MRTPSRSAPSGARLIEARIAPLRAALATHPVYAALHTVEDVRVFMQHHVFAVWDFMSLLKALQRALTSTEVPWRPVGSATTRRFINAIVLEEESDEVDGEAFSHFEMYRRAMLEIGADPGPCDRVVAAARTVSSIVKAMETQGVPPSVKAFVAATFGFVATEKPHVVAAAFTYGREEPIPDMFRALVAGLERKGQQAPTLKLYLDRHIHLDEHEHGPMAAAMLTELCGKDTVKWQEAAEAAALALEARLGLWSGVVAALSEKAPAPARQRRPARRKA